MKKRDDNTAWGLLSAMVIELVLAPGILGAGAYFLTGRLRNYFGWSAVPQLILTVVFSMMGLGIALYRINQISEKWDKNEH